MEEPYQQLIVWNPDAEEILGGYRYLLGNEVKFDEHGKPILATAHMFNFSEKFLKEYLPTTIELGRSFVTLEYRIYPGWIKKGCSHSIICGTD